MPEDKLVMNAIEAAAKAPDRRLVVETTASRARTRRRAQATIWNTGRNEQRRTRPHRDLAASIGKDMAIEGNFGMGAEVASLPSKTLGMRDR